MADTNAKNISSTAQFGSVQSGPEADFKSKLRGVYTALVTPFTENGKSIDYASVDLLLEKQIEAGVTGLVIAGSTGEAATLSDVEYGALVRYIVERSEGKLVCIAGVNSSSTAKAADLAVRASDSGAAGLLVVSPPYNKPTQAGIIRHFEEIYKSTHKPIVAYNIPGRAVSFLTPQTVASLALEGIIVGLKESSGSIDNCLDFIANVPAGFPIFSGDDSLNLAIMVHGGVGSVSVASNLAPRAMVRLCDSALAGDFQQAKMAQFELLSLIRAMYTETNPIAVKAALRLKNMIKDASLRLPLTMAQDSTIEKLQQLFSHRAFE